jgi:hypothetical protein
MATQSQPLFDMSKATPIAASQPLFDMSKATPIAGVTDTTAAPGTTGVSGFLNKVGEGGAEAASDIYGAVKGMVPGGAAETGAAKTVWNNLPPVQLADSVKQTLPLIHAYEQSRSKGASISDSLASVNEAAKQHSSNISQITPIVDAFKANPTRETARALLDATAAAASLLVGGEAATPEAEAAATAAKAPAVAAPEAAGMMTRLTNPFRKLLTSPKEAGLAATQEPGAAAIRTATGAAVDTPIRAGTTTAADDLLAKVGIQKDAAYKQIDDTVGFDLKAERQKLSDTQYAIKQPGADVPKLNAEMDISTKQIAEANTKLQAAGIDPKVADRLNTSWEANKGFKNDIVKSTSSDGNINVKQLLKRTADSRFNPKYGDRLAQAFGKGDVAAGKPIAEAYIKGLEAAQKAGVQAVHAQKVHQWIAGLIAPVGVGGYEGLKWWLGS